MLNVPREPSVYDIMHRDAREAERLLKKPCIDHLPDAVVAGAFTVPVGGKLVIERVASILPNQPWLDTRCYRVKSVDPEVGTLALLDDETGACAMSNFIAGQKFGYVFKAAPSKGSWDTLPREKAVTLPKTKKLSRTETKGTKAASGEVRRVYQTKGITHTRIGGVAYIPKGETRAKNGDRLMFSLTKGGSKCEVLFKDGSREMWLKEESL